MENENLYDFLQNFEKETYSEENMGLKDNKINLTKINFPDENNEKTAFSIFQIQIINNREEEPYLKKVYFDLNPLLISNHENLINIYFLKKTGISYNFYEEYIKDAKSLYKSFEEICNLNKNFNKELIIKEIIHQLIIALKFFRDNHNTNFLNLSPHHILINFGKKKLQVKLKRFCTSGILGIPDEEDVYFYSPEIINLKKTNSLNLIDKEQREKNNIWALGVLVYWMLFNENPFNNEDNINDGKYNMIMNKKVSKEIIEFIDKCIKYSPNLRPNLEEIENFEFLKKDSNNLIMLDLEKAVQLNNNINKLNFDSNEENNLEKYKNIFNQIKSIEEFDENIEIISRNNIIEENNNELKEFFKKKNNDKKNIKGNNNINIKTMTIQEIDTPGDAILDLNQNNNFNLEN
jgi:serine/threonine protein kinase